MTLKEAGDEMARIAEEAGCDDIIAKGIKLHAAVFRDFIKGMRTAQNPFVIAFMRVLLARMEADMDEIGMELEKRIEEAITAVSVAIERSDDA